MSPQRRKGRKPGPSLVTKELATRVRQACETLKRDDADDADHLVEALSVVADDKSAPLEVRLAATSRLAGCLAGNVYRARHGLEDA